MRYDTSTTLPRSFTSRRAPGRRSPDDTSCRDCPAGARNPLRARRHLLRGSSPDGRRRGPADRVGRSIPSGPVRCQTAVGQVVGAGRNRRSHNQLHGPTTPVRCAVPRGPLSGAHAQPRSTVRPLLHDSARGELVNREPWHLAAACRGTSADLNWTDDEDKPNTVAACLAVCRTCPVINQCRADAERFELRREHIMGTLGGLSARERRSRLRAK